MRSANAGRVGPRIANVGSQFLTVGADAVVYRSRTTPESSLNYAFVDDDAFDGGSWPLGERIDVLTDLVLHQGFTLNWDIGIE